MPFIDSKTRPLVWIGSGALALALAACSRDTEPARTGGVAAPAVAAQQYTLPATESKPTPPAAPDEDEGGATVHISDEMRARCGLPNDAEGAPRFEYDQATLRARGENVLDGVARCLKDGPLKDATITLVGRTDPRGSEEYNEALGRSRAAAARNYLVEHGVPADRIILASRGEEGASGKDEASWALDRRVDLELGGKIATTAASATPTPAATGGANQPILEGTRLQIETSEAKKEEHPNAMSYSDTAEGGKPVGGSKSSSVVSGSASGSVTVGAQR